tara:strand:- start:2050 stop:2298 length:249 start_codon:yes stop_codon:yes gene_type:complete
MATKKKRDYKKEYARDHASRKAKVARAKRNAANRKLQPGDGNEVDHLVPLSKGGTNTRKNLRVVSRTANRKKGSRISARKRK